MIISGSGSPPSFVLPASFNPSEFLTDPALARSHDDARYLVSLILVNSAKLKQTGFIHLKYDYLRAVMAKRRCAKVIKALIIGGAIQIKPHRIRSKSRGYRLSDRFLGDKHVRVAITDRFMMRRLERLSKRKSEQQELRKKPVHKALEQLQKRLTIDVDQARAILATLPPECNPYDQQGVLIANIADGIHHLSVGRYGRITNNISSLKKELRTALRADGQPLVSKDLSCTQPALIAKMIQDERRGTTTRATNSNRSTKDQEEGDPKRQAAGQQQQTPTASQGINGGTIGSEVPSDFSLYCSLTASGALYEHLQLCASQAGMAMPINKVKRELLSNVIAKRRTMSGRKYPSAFENVFRAQFPTVYEYINRVNQDGRRHKNLIRRLQREEARFVIETVAADLVERHPEVFFLTLHDAIYTTEEHISKVVDAFDRCFQKIGFTMKLKDGE